MKNEGKIFEDSFKNSVPKDILLKRLNDNAASFGGSMNTRFSSTNECDFILFNGSLGKLYCLELKSTLSSLTYWREDFEKYDESGKKQKQSFQIKKNQIEGLCKFNNYKNTTCGFIINFRNTDGNNTYYVDIDNFLEYTGKLDKKTVNEKDILLMNPVVIECEKKRTRYKYNLENFLGIKGE